MNKEINLLQAEKFNRLAQEKPKRPKVLMVTHHTINDPPFGGVEVYQHILIETLRDRFEFFTYSPVDRKDIQFGQEYQLLNENQKVIKQYNMLKKFDDYQLTCPEREKEFSKLLSEYNFDLIHFQHLIGHPPSLPFISKAVGIPSLISLHDFFVACKYINLIGIQGSYCNAPNIPIETCDQCLSTRDRALAGSQSIRRAFFSSMLQQVDGIISNTPYLTSLFKKFYPLPLSEKSVFNLAPPIRSLKNSVTAHRESKGVLKAAVLGNFTHLKGGAALIEIFDQLKDDPIEFHIFGNLERSFSEHFKSAQYRNVTSHGPFQEGTAYEKLNGMDLSLHLSIAPETYCLTLSEAWQAKLVPIVSNIGALGERVVEGKNGFKVPPQESETAVRLLKRLIQNPKEIETIRQNLNDSNFLTEVQHCDSLATIYKSTIDLRHSSLKASELTLAQTGVHLSQKSWLTQTPESSAPGVKAYRLFRRVKNYVKTHGVRITLSRISNEFVLRIRNGKK